MKKFEYKFSVSADSQQEADEKMKALIQLVNKLSATELKKISEVVNNPVQLKIIKAKLGV